MSILIPPAVNYPSPIIALPTVYKKSPVEGPCIIPVLIEWSTMGGDAKCVSINTQNNTNNPISQIVALDVDNSRCGSDVTFIFPDSSQTLTVPAYESVLAPVFTIATQFFVSATAATAGDETSFSIQNTLPPPLSVPKSELLNVSSTVDIALNAAAEYTIIANGQNGTIDGINLQASGGSPAAYNTAVQLQDGNGAILYNSLCSGPAGYYFNSSLASVSGAQIRFKNGVKLFIVNNGGLCDANSYLSLNVFYRSP